MSIKSMIPLALPSQISRPPVFLKMDNVPSIIRHSHRIHRTSEPRILRYRLLTRSTRSDERGGG
ncbi:hypothetical protein M407DRAFT_246729 [Tulasnella calospora MUT 4182]|uniref:Uncharacterized protein n=1 Tax=Tulasnella calospora MUT 4182 TaxID=1051891 RepID=A0A0C3L7L0_9AGAM|nr:hypothetical protein M407DRAFT_246729 [Tulasnella calospora MUT 4182]